MTEELWQQLGHSHDDRWPTTLAQLRRGQVRGETMEIAVQVNGKVKARLKVAADIESC